MASCAADGDDYRLTHAVRDVFGSELTWVSWLAVIAGGLLGAACAPLVRGPADAPRQWAGLFTCVALGVVFGGLFTLLPRLVSLLALSASLRSRPADLSDVDRPWWPLRLVAAALADSPPLRRTAQDFGEAINAIVPQARGLIGRRMWPACAAAFAAPAFGLVGAWQAWAVFIDSGEFKSGRVPTVGEAAALPMVVAIIAGLVLMLAVVGLDQLLRRVLQRWETTVRPSDAEVGFVAARLGDGLAPVSGQLPAAPTVVMPPPRSVPAPASQPLSADALEGLGKLFENG